MQLRPRFSVLAAIGIQYSISATPLAIGGYLTFILGVGGSPFFFYCFLVAVTGQMLVCLSLAEIASVYPHASGQVFWTAALAPPEWKRFLSYCNGAATMLGWIFANAGTYVFAAQIWLAAMTVRFPDFQSEPWQAFLTVVACAVFGVVLNVWLFRWYPYITTFMVFFINVGTLYVFVTLLVRANPKASASQVFVDVVNETGWESLGVVFLIGFLPGCVAISCFDTAAHMAEEMEIPERQVPQVMIGASSLCALTAIPMILVFLFCTVAPENLLAPLGGQPVFQVFIDGFASDALVAIALAIYCVVYLSSVPAAIATASRLVWSFAKHGGIPFRGWVGRVDPAREIPINAVYLTAGISTLIGLLVLGPTTVLNGVFGAGGVCFFISYGLPVWLVLWRGRGVLPANRYVHLGRFGLAVNVLTVAWQCLTVVFLCFPLYQPVTLDNMNWASLCAVVGLSVFAVNWFVYASRHYETPKALFVSGIHGAGRHQA
ncbi:amino acid/polyamine transporter I [Microdochium trichocladiopsis]|uniref:Amino acid/polyamine transporter I n=1 Tax=Microdochium trichocladiopsis TaxID=1682393 RepID=A0A9P8YAW0_9PEZI|nr:amino acid/polyamine transporter I [Microdochium trichocladiopsis]KAH7034674.1 amino acid/polyamine transporter I [Microdochium trichocladiopsis]